ASNDGGPATTSIRKSHLQGQPVTRFSALALWTGRHGSVRRSDRLRPWGPLAGRRLYGVHGRRTAFRLSARDSWTHWPHREPRSQGLTPNRQRGLLLGYGRLSESSIEDAASALSAIVIEAGATFSRPTKSSHERRGGWV